VAGLREEQTRMIKVVFYDVENDFEYESELNKDATEVLINSQPVVCHEGDEYRITDVDYDIVSERFRFFISKKEA
jgi:hypothetical protein